MNYQTKIYKVIDGTDNWPLVKTVEADTYDECEEKANDYVSGHEDEYHWLAPEQA